MLDAEHIGLSVQSEMDWLDRQESGSTQQSSDTDMVYTIVDFNHEHPAQHSLTATTFYNVYEECVSLHPIVDLVVHAKQRQ